MDYINLLSEYLPQEQICIVIEHNNSPYIYYTNYSFILIFIPDFEYFIPKKFRYFYDLKTINIFKSDFIKGKFYHHEYNYNTNLLDEICNDNNLLNDFVFKLKKRSSGEYKLVAYHYKEIAVNIIDRYWKKYRWNYLRNLAAWKYHPSKLIFEID